MNFQQAQEYLYEKLPVFHRQGAPAYKADIKTTVDLMTLLDNPQQKFNSIHVAGTNGKGSSCHLLASICKENGFRTGLHTSPHLKDLTERIVINGKKVAKVYVTQFIERYKQDIERLQPSFFELMVAMAFKHFANNTDICVIEVGMGGRLDSTNVIMPEVSLITNISLDHTQFLGDTLEKIAVEKAGIIKKGVPVVISQTQKQTENVFIQKANQMGSDIYFADQNFRVENVRYEADKQIMDIYYKNQEYLKNLVCPLLGQYQQKNILGVLQVIEVLNQRNRYIFSIEDIRRGIENSQLNFPILGRWQTLSTMPLTICDTGHNVDGLTYVINQLKQYDNIPLHFVIGVVNDKDVDTEIDMLPKRAKYYLCKANIPRGLEVKILADKFKSKNMNFQTFDSVREALSIAQQEALNSNGMVFVGGSTYTVAEIV